MNRKKTYMKPLANLIASLPESIKTVAQARRFWKLLLDAGCFYHLDDSAADLVEHGTDGNKRVFSVKVARRIEALQDEAFHACRRRNLDPYEIALEVMHSHPSFRND